MTYAEIKQLDPSGTTILGNHAGSYTLEVFGHTADVSFQVSHVQENGQPVNPNYGTDDTFAVGENKTRQGFTYNKLAMRLTCAPGTTGSFVFMQGQSALNM